ncbi:alpha/beta fold hydrolase [Mycobacterium sp. AZCC_0083]|uniref:alpha/beta fold hydrolase n=1 Tax=Mycobacterium sp. AZCC_0083 TaxID=2735882 RepID=UPI001616F3EE|nr:alpha/beta hydrolase [Mycobacterium sp. AZCC_0083]MBB5166302.1 pimeloyl-ACP methyl ester carboxylesterase [Mycobacterium sp. AZCC_0083]
MGEAIQPKSTIVGGLSIRFAEGGAGLRDALLLSPWPESLFAFDQVWALLGEHTRLIAVDLPGFGGSERSEALMNPKAMGEFVVRVADAFGLDKPHVVAPDIGTSASLFAAAAHPDRLASLVIGSGGAAVPLSLTGPLKDWVEATDLEPYRQIGGRKIIEILLSSIKGYTPSDAIYQDYVNSYQGDKFADSMAYVQAYPEQLPVLGELLTGIQTPVRIVQGSADEVVPAANANYLGQRLPNSSVDFIVAAGHFCWEERPRTYASLVIDWWNRTTRPARG